MLNDSAFYATLMACFFGAVYILYWILKRQNSELLESEVESLLEYSDRCFTTGQIGDMIQAKYPKQSLLGLRATLFSLVKAGVLEHSLGGPRNDRDQWRTKNVHMRGALNK